MLRTTPDDEPLRHFPVLRSRDVDEVRELGERLFAPHRLEPLEQAEPLDARLNAVHIRDVTIGYVQYGPQVGITVPDMADSYQFNIPIAGRMEISDGRRTITSGVSRSAVLAPGAGYVGRWTSGCRQVAINISRAGLEGELERQLGRPIRGPVRFDLGVDLDEPMGQSWLATVELAMGELDRARSVLLHPRAADHLEQLLILGALLSARHDYSAELVEPAPPPGPRTVTRAVELIEEHVDEPLTVSELAHAVGVSVRCLQEGFRRHLGTSPMAYLRELRLAGAHRALVEASADATTVTAVAHRWGFTHLGRFSAAYRRKYGVSPSRTLRGAPARVPQPRSCAKPVNGRAHRIVEPHPGP
ncbi:AraC family transcriptional regulator [Saccharopolyspora rhizosphaerae]|uniref:AraC family transcriptional regulator n=1 Tax=Saccharopolyspora rhizosphaerae TaxID=2492662 RepID=A0A3R8VG92_9PSEU|nr:AraC family transcriptional regulator [Saccharopolyspora rhizosphaerae]RRO16898.1 AraC family transcriptional regulator [Saccharopolyspora rhizosphaerae]